MNDINTLLWRVNVCVRRISVALATLLGWLRPYLACACVLRNRAAATGPPLLGFRRWAAEPPPPVGRRWAATAGPSPRPRMCGACAGERRKFDSIGVGVTGTPRPVVKHPPRPSYPHYVSSVRTGVCFTPQILEKSLGIT